MAFKKGYHPWNKGLKTGPLSKEHKRKIQTRMKVSAINKGKHNSPNTEFKNGHKVLGGIKTRFKKRQAPWNKNKSLAIEHKKKISLAVSGEKNHCWKGGISFEPYGLEFNSLLKEQIRQRDNYRCQECFRHQDELKGLLNVHHIDFNKKNNNPSNLISLCNSCHAQTNFNRDNWATYFNNIMGMGK